jgi:hypothetical protein
MTLRRLEILQWLGLLAGAAVWAAQHVLGFGITQAECGLGGAHWGISNDVWEGSLMAAAATVVLGAAGASLAVLVATRNVTYESDPPPGRMRFFAIAAVVANLVFLMIILLDGFASILDTPCRQG